MKRVIEINESTYERLIESRGMSVSAFVGFAEALKKSTPLDEVLDKIRAEIEPKCDRIHNLISVYPNAERRDIEELLCEIMDLCDAESEE